MQRPSDATIDSVNDDVDFMSGLTSYLETHYHIQAAKLVSLDTNVFRVDQADQPHWVARVFPSKSSTAVTEAQSYAKILLFLQQRGFPAEKCAHENPVSTFRGREVLVTEFLHGSSPKPSAETFHKLGDLLGRLHTLPVDGAGLNWKGGAWHHLLFPGGPQEELAAASALLSQAKSRSAPEEHTAYEELQSQLERIDPFTDLPESLVHPDFVPSNVIQLPDGTLVPVDWTGSGQGPRIFSLSWLLFVAGHNGIEMVEAVVSGYRPHVSMGTQELSHLSNSILLRNLAIICWDVYHGRRKVLNVVKRVPKIQTFAEKTSNSATAAFADKELKTPAENNNQGEGSKPNLPLSEVGATSLYTAAIRAEESKLPNRLFNDHLAQAFMSHWNYALPSGQNPLIAGFLKKFIVARTVFLDDILLSAIRSGCSQAVLLAAGMDIRAFRLTLPSQMCVFELDTVDVIESKNLVLEGNSVSPVCSRIPVPCDLLADWHVKLLAAGFCPEKPTAWIAEGIFAYFEEDVVNNVIRELTAISAPGSRMGLDMAGHGEVDRTPGGLHVSTAPLDPVIWLAEHGWDAHVTNTREVLRAHGRIPREADASKANLPPKPVAIFIDATRKL